MKTNVYKTVEKLLKNTDKYISEDNKLLKVKIYEDIIRMDEQLLDILLSDNLVKETFFKKIKNTLVFDKQKFARFVESKEFLEDSYTSYINKIGLTSNGEFISNSNDVVLDFPFKDCYLYGGQDKDDQKRKEIFYNELIASDDIRQMLAPKVLGDAKKYTKNGVEETSEFDENDNLIIKGNNLIALASLLKRYEGKVKCIYIDPPYNTGNDSFNYNDKFNHSSWLVFMKNRLELARRLLRDDGVIFVQCDDNEQAYLKVLMDEMFGKNNHYGTMIQLKKSTQNDNKSIQKNHEYIHVFSKTNLPLLMTYEKPQEKEIFIDESLILTLPLNNSFENVNSNSITKRYFYEGTGNGVTGNNNQLIDRPNLGYTIYYIELTENEIKAFSERIISLNNLEYTSFNFIKVNDKYKHAIAINDYISTGLTERSKEEDIYVTNEELINQGYSIIRPPKRVGGKLGCWTWSLDNFKKNWNNNEVIIKKGHIFKKEYINNKNLIEARYDKYYYKKTNILPPKSIVDISNSQGTKHLVQIFNDKIFSNPKSEELLQHIIRLSTKPSDIILDFFLGSGTTAAVAHKMNRRYIGIEQMDYIQDITIERLKKVINGEQGGISKSVNWQGGGSFLYCELIENAKQLINDIQKADESNILELKNKIFNDERVIPYITKSELEKYNQEFENLSLEDKKKVLIKIIDKNKLYINYSEINDKDYNIQQSDKYFSNSFYKGE
ncbi:site-specific DNA-methyltransferase [Mycoplasma capricolum subsp. capricolum]|uniref:DNA methyltransferase n=1 Tax=Mycoplasma capricolum TaxID=2095 RepID=UPI003DA2BEB0